MDTMKREAEAAGRSCESKTCLGPDVCTHTSAFSSGSACGGTKVETVRLTPVSANLEEKPLLLRSTVPHVRSLEDL